MSILLGLLVAVAQPTAPATQEPDAWTKLVRYELERAKTRFRDLREDAEQAEITSIQSRELEGRQGSRMTVFCADARVRYSGKDYSKKFFYVLDVSPAATLPSSYERGSFESNDADERGEDFAKLCDGPTSGLDDIQMLKSDVHTSGGSRFKPFLNDSGRADRDRLVGGWVSDGATCNYELSYLFDSDGTYGNIYEAGAWAIERGKLTLRIEKQWTDDEKTLMRFAPPKIERYTVKRTGIDSMSLIAPDGTDDSLVRC